MAGKPTPAVMKKLFALSGNVCAFSGCMAPLVDPSTKTLIGVACHIKGENPGGPRYDPGQSETERRGLDNLVAMCPNHHKIIDDRANLHIYTVERLLEIKRACNAPIARLSLSFVIEDQIRNSIGVECIVVSLQAERGDGARRPFRFDLELPFLPHRPSLDPLNPGRSAPLIQPVLGTQRSGNSWKHWRQYQKANTWWIAFRSYEDENIWPNSSDILCQFGLPASWYALESPPRNADPRQELYQCGCVMEYEGLAAHDQPVPWDFFELVPGRH